MLFTRLLFCTMESMLPFVVWCIGLSMRRNVNRLTIVPYSVVLCVDSRIRSFSSEMPVFCESNLLSIVLITIRWVLCLLFTTLAFYWRKPVLFMLFCFLFVIGSWIVFFHARMKSYGSWVLWAIQTVRRSCRMPYLFHRHLIVMCGTTWVVFSEPYGGSFIISDSVDSSVLCFVNMEFDRIALLSYISYPYSSFVLQQLTQMQHSCQSHPDRKSVV